MSVLRRLISGDVEQRRYDGPWGPYADGSIPPPGYESMSSAGVPVTQGKASQLVDAYSCISHIADTVAKLPWQAFRKRGGHAEQVDPPRLLVDPHPEWPGLMGRQVLAHQIAWSMATRGEAIALVAARDVNLYPTQLQPVNPDDVAVRRNPDSGSREYRLQGDREWIPRSEVLHIPLHIEAGHTRGISPIGHHRRLLGLGIATEDYGSHWFADGASPSSVLETDADMSTEAARENQARWVASHGGRRRPALLTGGLKWRPVVIAPNESQFLETRELNSYQIARIWRMPPHLVGLTSKQTSFGSGLEEMGIGYVVYTLGTYLSRIEPAFSQILPGQQYMKANVMELLRGRQKDRYAAYAIGRQWGWLSVNDIRGLEDLPPVEGGDTYLQPLNMIEAKKALAALFKDDPETDADAFAGDDQEDQDALTP